MTLREDGALLQPVLLPADLALELASFARPVLVPPGRVLFRRFEFLFPQDFPRRYELCRPERGCQSRRVRV